MEIFSGTVVQDGLICEICPRSPIFDSVEDFVDSLNLNRLEDRQILDYTV